MIHVTELGDDVPITCLGDLVEKFVQGVQPA